MRVIVAAAAAALFSVFLGVFFGFTMGSPAAADDVAAASFQDSETGRTVYEARCASCHQSDGAGIPGAFPPLAGNPNSADAAYVESVIRDGLSGPIEVLGSTYNAVMAPIDLSDSELADVVAFVGTLAAVTTEPPTTVPPPATPADAEHGEALFSGGASFENGGGACHACHSAGSVSFRGGAGLGPDLTDAFDRFGGEAGMSAWLRNPASETMLPLFTDAPLTESEIADLVAFFAEVRTEEPAGGVDQLLLAGFGGLLVLLAVMAFWIRGPQETYAQRLRRRR